MARVQILTIGVDKVTMDEAVTRCLDWMAADQPRLVVTPNAEIAYAAYQNPEQARLVNEADLVIPDGSGIVLASRLLGDPVSEKVAGIELSTRLVAELSRQGRGRIFLLGTKPELVAEAARRLKAQYPGVTVAGYHHGFFTAQEEPAVIESIRQAAPDLLFVGLGSPRQERWLKQHLPALNAKVGLAVGGTLDGWAGVAPRAPRWMQRIHLEWLFRIVKFGRYSRSLPPLAKFVLLVLKQRMSGR